MIVATAPAGLALTKAGSLAHLFGIDAAILIDSVSNDAPPGTVTLFRKTDILRHGPSPVRMDPHSPALSESLLIAELAGEGPEDILLIGITGEQYEAGTALSEAALGGSAKTIKEVLVELKRLVIFYSESQKKPFLDWWRPKADSLPLTTCSQA